MITSKAQFDSIFNQAKEGNLDSETLDDLGLVFEEGLVENDISVIEIDYEQSFYWYERAMEKGNINATIRLADYLSDGLGCNKDTEKAIGLYLSCIERGSSVAAHNLGVLYRDLKNYAEAFKYYELSNDLLSEEHGKETYIIDVAMRYLYGIGVEQNIDIAIKQLEELVDDDNDYTCDYDIDEANYLLGLIYLQGMGVSKDIDKARHYLLEANIDEDHRSSQELLFLIGKTN